MDIKQKLTEFVNLANGVKAFVSEYEKNIEAKQRNEKQLNERIVELEKKSSQISGEILMKQQEFQKKADAANLEITNTRSIAERLLNEARDKDSKATEALNDAKVKRAYVEKELAEVMGMKREYEEKVNKLKNALS